MANQTADSFITRFSTLATDPLRSFRFIVEFTDPAQNGETVFSPKITSTADARTSTTAMSSGFVGGFVSVGGLNITTQAIQYREGGYNTTVHQIPGMTTFTPITLQRGVLYGNDQAITWMRGLFAAVSGDGITSGALSNKGYRVNAKIWVMDHPNTAVGNTPRMGFDIKNAWITQLSYTDLNANDGAILFESINLVHEGLSVFFTDSNYAPVERTSALN
jgi:phage tail-like protein